MTRTATRPAAAVPSEDGPPLDPEAVSHAYRLHRARRHARDRRRREQRWASVRFWLVLVLVIAATAFLALRTMGEIERVFGL